MIQLLEKVSAKLHLHQSSIDIAHCEYKKQNKEGKPAEIIYCPQEIKRESKNLCCLVYRSGRAVLVGGKNLQEIEEFFTWVIKIVERYTT